MKLCNYFALIWIFKHLVSFYEDHNVDCECEVCALCNLDKKKIKKIFVNFAAKF